MFHAYPHNLTEIPLEKWYSDRIGLRLSDAHDEVLHDQWAEAEAVEELISTCYQISMLREEERPLRFMNTLAESYEDPNQADLIVGWKNYITSNKDDTLMLLDEAIFEYAHFIAGLTAVDGAVVISQRQEVMGFGGMILGSLDRVSVVARSLDFEGESKALEPVDRAGMRHRAVYNLCNEIRDALAIVISQDGDVNIVMWKNGIVTYWDVDPWVLTQFHDMT